MSYTNKEKALIFIDGFLNLEYKHKRQIINLYEDISTLFDFPNLALEYINENVSSKGSELFKLCLTNEFLNNLLEKYENRRIKIVTEISTEYPRRLIPLDFRPICLYCKGNVNLLNSENTFAIVGSRKTDSVILNTVTEFANNLTKNGVTVVTGIASGADLSAIKGCYKSGKIIIVMASGSDFWQGEQNRDYLTKIQDEGLVISEYPPEVAPRNYFYPIRNRIIAGLSDGVLIASGNYKSGARHTANYALDYGVEVFAFPYSIGSFGGELCNSLIKDGAHLVMEYSDISEIMGYNGANEVNSSVSLSQEEISVLECIEEGKSLVDDMLLKTNLKIYQLIPILTTLELKGLIVNEGGNKYVKTTRKI